MAALGSAVAMSPCRSEGSADGLRHEAGEERVGETEGGCRGASRGELAAVSGSGDQASAFQATRVEGRGGATPTLVPGIQQHESRDSKGQHRRPFLALASSRLDRCLALLAGSPHPP